jgi:hypothetical protein
LNSLGKGVNELKKPYKTPTLAVYGSLEEITMGLGGSSPDVGGININCLTGIVGTVTIICTSGPS